MRPEPYSLFSARLWPLAVPIGLVLAIFGSSIFFASQYLRQNSREQIMGQHAQILYALWLSQKDSDLASGTAENVSDQLPTVLQTARLRQLVNLLGTRIFDANGNFAFADANVSEGRLAPDILQRLKALQPVAQLRESADLSEVSFIVSPDEPSHGPLLDVYIPLHPPSSGQLNGVAEFIQDGTEVARELRRFDRHLILQATVTFVVGGGLLVLILGASFRQLQRMNQLLSERTQGLLRANEELALAAKTSAVGAVTAHLIHGLKNPLSGLQNFVASHQAGSAGESKTDWDLAISSTRRMQALIGDIVRVLRDHHNDSQYELTLPELAAMLEAKVRPLAQQAGVTFCCEQAATGTLRNREANLISLVLYNLVQNAIEATPRGKRVVLSFRETDRRILCEVRDEGPGITPMQQKNLFAPCRSRKEGGSGIGLAISKQLSKCIGAELELKESNGDGSTFLLAFSTEREISQLNLAAAGGTS
ncbi:MAG: HAMP domain-containing sensor histidine kinase [Verrucomicrobiota bacterium]